MKVKLLKISLLITAIVIVTFSSCKKDEELTNPSNSETLTRALPPPANNLRVWHDNGNINGVEGIDFGCWGSGGNCGPDVVIVAERIEPLRSMQNNILECNPEALKETVRSNFGVLSEVFSESVLRSVIDGDLTLSVKGDLSPNTTIYFLIYEDNVLRKVQPVRM